MKKFTVEELSKSLRLANESDTDCIAEDFLLALDYNAMGVSRDDALVAASAAHVLDLDFASANYEGSIEFSGKHGLVLNFKNTYTAESILQHENVSIGHIVIGCE